MDHFAGDDESDASAQQTTVWRQITARAKPLLSPKLGSRDPEEKKEKSMWMFKKMKRKENVSLDRIISSSQPDLLFASAPDPEAHEEKQLCGKAAGMSGSGGSGIKERIPSKLTVAHLIQTHHKSSSLGSACLEKLAEPPGGGSGSSGRSGEAGEAAGAVETEQEEQQCRSTLRLNGPLYEIVRGRITEECREINVSQLVSQDYSFRIIIRSSSSSSSSSSLSVNFPGEVFFFSCKSGITQVS
ncbi:hypothetical protein NQZ68_038367 [Dissostichus eleginoides]|nr:hypothetical protein NQZ68_038367 [Dissostichus eleginoides]